MNMAAIRQEKDRSSVGADSPVETKNFDGESFGVSESNHIDYRKQHYDVPYSY